MEARKTVAIMYNPQINVTQSLNNDRTGALHLHLPIYNQKSSSCGAEKIETGLG